MTEIDMAQLADLNKLAKDRCRKAFMLVAQLVDDDKQRAAMLTSVAADFIRGAALLLAEEGMSPEDATETVIDQLLNGVGIKYEKRPLP